MAGQSDEQLLARLASTLAAMQPARTLAQNSAATLLEWDDLFVEFGLKLGIDERVRLKTKIQAELKAAAGAGPA
jgi:hypothetical protein